MRITISLSTENAAFEEHGCPSWETARILRELADRVEGHPHFSPGHSQPLRDINGNEIGHLDIYHDLKPGDPPQEQVGKTNEG